MQRHRPDPRPMPPLSHSHPTGTSAATPAARSSRISQALPPPPPSCAASCAGRPAGEPAAACARVEPIASGALRADPTALMAGCRLECSADASRLRGGSARGGAAGARAVLDGAALDGAALDGAALDAAILEGASLAARCAAAAWRPSRSRLGGPSANTSERSSTGVSIPGPLLPQGSCSHWIGAPIGADRARTCFQPALHPRAPRSRTSMQPPGWAPGGACHQDGAHVEPGRGPDHRGAGPQESQVEAGQVERLGAQEACDIRDRWGRVSSSCASAAGEGGETPA